MKSRVVVRGTTRRQRRLAAPVEKERVGARDGRGESSGTRRRQWRRRGPRGGAGGRVTAAAQAGPGRRQTTAAVIIVIKETFNHTVGCWFGQ